MTVTVIFTPACGHVIPHSYNNNFLADMERSMQLALDEDDLQHKIATCNTDLLYVVESKSSCTRPVGKSVLPGLYYSLVRQEDIFYGGRTEQVQLLTSKEDGLFREVTDVDTGIVRSSYEPLKVLVAVLSCHKNKDKQDACRNTWCSCLPEGVDYRIYVGNGSSGYAPNDVVQVQYADDYQSVPGKQLEFYKWALNNLSFEWLFQVDDDTYAAPDRILDLLDPEYDMIGTLMHEEILHGGVGYFIHRRLLRRMCSEESELWLSGNGDWQFTKLARKLNARIKNIQMGYMDYEKSPWPAAKNKVVTTHYVPPNVMRDMHKKYTDSTGFYDRKQERIAVVGLFVGKYLGLLEGWYDNMETYLDPTRKKDYYIITDRPAADVHTIIRDAKVYHKSPENRIWFLMLNKSLLLLPEQELRSHNLVVYAQADARWTRQKLYKELLPTEGAYWRSTHSTLWHTTDLYDQGAISGAPFINDFSPIENKCAPWVMGMCATFKGSAVHGWATYFMRRMQECWDMGIYPPWHEESLLNRMAFGMPGTCNTETIIFSPDGTRDLIVADKSYLGVDHHNAYTRPEQDVTY